MFLFLTFASLIFSMSSAPHIPPVAAATISQSTSIPSDLDRFQQASIYSGNECRNCSTTTNSTSAAR
jgi:hypothetical protein